MSTTANESQSPLAWRGDVERDRPADAFLGQPGLTTAFEHAYRPQGPRSLRFPDVVAGRHGARFVADTANNRTRLPGDLEARLDSDFNVTLGRVPE